MKKSVFIAVDNYHCSKNFHKKFTNNFLHYEKKTSCPIIKNYLMLDFIKIIE